MKQAIPGRFQVVYRTAGQAIGHLADPGSQRRRNPGKCSLVVCGAQGFQLTAGAPGEHTVALRMFPGRRQNGLKQAGGELRHIARHYQIPIRQGVGKRGFDASQGTRSGEPVGDNRISEAAVDFRLADNRDAARRILHREGGNFDQSQVTGTQESLVPPHPGTGAPREHKARCLHATDDIIRGYKFSSVKSLFRRAGGSLSSPDKSLRLNLNSKKMKSICFIILGWMMVSAATLPVFAQNGRVTVVVHADLHTGKLVSSVVVSPKVVGPAEPRTALQETAPVPLSSNMIEMIDQIAKAHDVEPPLVHSVIRAESNYNVRAVSNKGALGLMQLIPSTARRFGVADAFDPKQNIEGGVRYLRFLLDYFKGDYPKVIAAYNAGENAVDRFRGIPPYEETRNYVYQVAKNLKAARLAAELKAKSAPTASPVPVLTASTTPEETYNPIRASVSEDGKVIYRTQ